MKSRMMAGVGRSAFYPLRVAAIDRLTDDSVAITFDVPPEHKPPTSPSRPGQHVTLRCLAAGDDVRRTYSLCSRPGVLRIGVRQVPGGVFSRHALTALKVGDEIEVMPPHGNFVSRLDRSVPRHRGAIVAGSGITPVLSIIATTLETEPASTFSLIYANRTAHTVMFLDELAELKDRFPDRLAVFHVLSREVRDSPLLSGRLDRAKLDALLDIVDAADDRRVVPVRAARSRRAGTCGAARSWRRRRGRASRTVLSRHRCSIRVLTWRQILRKRLRRSR